MFGYSTPDDVKPEFGAWSSRIEWCQDKCQGPWKYKGRGKFQFWNEKDYTLFLLRWS